MKKIVIVGAGIAGLTLALSLHARGLSVKVFEAAPRIEPVGVGINIQPYATQVLHELGLLETLARQSVTTKEMVFFTRHGQRIHSLPLGKYGGHDFPQLSIHRGILQLVLLKAATERLGPDFLVTGHSFISLAQNERSVKAIFSSASTNAGIVNVECNALIGADGVHSNVYRSLYPDGPQAEGNGVLMWRGVTIAPPFLTGASMVRVGVPSHGKLVIYPIRNQVNARGDQLINWVAELDEAVYRDGSNAAPGNDRDFIRFFASRTFDWLDAPNLLERAACPIIAMPMADRDPLPRWQSGRVTLIGDAAHPMVPVGSNGAGQAILDAHCLGKRLAETPDVYEALSIYEHDRRTYTSNIVLGDRLDLPDRLIDEVDRRSNGAPFSDIDDIIERDEASTLALPDYHGRPLAPAQANAA
ncbi:monooxygenase [Burkholderia savannae]|uniref:flavin-dependent oxidoreductase n=1 Tax=Burkholderia savannae TaxID=1637837 RepID=UPI00075B7119|nr:flavin-dependent oxidoreductase [Burkholderia savannae]AOJ84674.1 monooxygenase [Burkholderia savannae]